MGQLRDEMKRAVVESTDANIYLINYKCYIYVTSYVRQVFCIVSMYVYLLPKAHGTIFVAIWRIKDEVCT